MKKFLVFFLAVLVLTFVACGKDKDIESYLDMEKNQSEFNIEKQDNEQIKFTDKDEPILERIVKSYIKMKVL